MKELSIEEKAKAYDEAIERAKEYLGDCMLTRQEYIEKVFPELEENEDEKIRKAIIRLFELETECKLLPTSNSYTYGKAISWLEKQGEQKETLCDKCRKSQPSHSCQDITALGRCALEKQCEQKSLFPDNEIRDIWEYIAQFKTLYGHYPSDADEIEVIVREAISKRTSGKWSKEDEDKLNYAIIQLKAASNVIIDDEVDGSIAFIQSLKDRVLQPQPKCEWSEDDEQYLEDTLYLLEGHRSKNTYGDVVEWIKELKDRVQSKIEWSKEDKKMLDEMYEFFDKHKVTSLKHGMDDYAKFIKSFKDKVQI